MAQPHTQYSRSSGNLGQTGLRKRARTADPMRAYDKAPKELRLWMAQAVLPWSPRSCVRLWTRWRKSGVSVEEALTRLTEAERKTLARAESPSH